jgi:hypothetical protein
MSTKNLDVLLTEAVNSSNLTELSELIVSMGWNSFVSALIGLVQNSSKVRRMLNNPIDVVAALKEIQAKATQQNEEDDDWDSPIEKFKNVNKTPKNLKLKETKEIDGFWYWIASYDNLLGSGQTPPVGPFRSEEEAIKDFNGFAIRQTKKEK